MDFLSQLTLTFMLFFWGALTIFFVVIEASSAALIAFWFILGSLAAFVAALCGAPVLVQCIVFVLTSILTLAFMRSLLVRWIGVRNVATNVNSIVGMKGVVLSTIDNLQGSGRVHVNGLDWSAKSESDERLEPNQTILVKEVQGVTLIVVADTTEKTE